MSTVADVAHVVAIGGLLGLCAWIWSTGGLGTGVFTLAILMNAYSVGRWHAGKLYDRMHAEFVRDVNDMLKRAGIER